ncbi:MAG: GNAT family N-acetyltransferase, partial [Thermoplasmata archaeon]
MRFLRYDEIDPLEAFAISMCGFDWPLTPERLEERIRYDDRWFEDSLLYAVVKGKAVSQAVALRIPTRTVDGEELVAGIAGVATLPSFSRKGISSKLMQELHSRLLEEGIRISFLNTGESLVAYSMYTKLGYRRATYFPSAWKPLSVRKKPMPSILRKYKKKDGAEVDEAYGRFTEGLYGFVIRQKEFFSARMKIHKELKDRLFVVEGNEGVCGYVVKREQDGDV